MGSGFKTFTTASVLTASDVNNYLMEQSVMSFASTGARDVAITAPEAGMVAYIRSNDSSEGLYHRTSASTWRKGPGWNAPWGVMGSAKITTATAATAATLVTGSSIDYSQIQNRRYKYTVFGHALWSVAGVTSDLFGCAITNGTGTVFSDCNVNPTGTGLSSSFATAFAFTWYEDAASSAAITRQLRVRRAAGAGGTVTFFADATRIGSFIIEDIGPSGAPV
jgi:hypothetical protein